MMNKYIIVFLTVIFVIAVETKKSGEEDKPTWTKKDIRDYSDADMERLLDQWNVSVI